MTQGKIEAEKIFQICKMIIDIPFTFRVVCRKLRQFGGSQDEAEN